MVKNNQTSWPDSNRFGEIDWSHFSLDSIFFAKVLLMDFEGTGGLYDTQVELGNTKRVLVNSRPSIFPHFKGAKALMG